MTVHRRSHLTEAVAQIQNEQTLLVDGAAATNVLPVPGIKVDDNLKSVTNVLAAPPVPYTAYTIYQPQAVATLVVVAAFAVDSYVTVGGLKFLFVADKGQLDEDNFPVGSNASNRYQVEFDGTPATDLQNLVDAINEAYTTESGGVLADVTAAVNGTDLDLVAGAYGAAGEVVQVGLSDDLVTGGSEWQDAAAAATDTLKVAAGDVEGIVSATDDSTAAGAGGVEVVWQPYANNEAQDVSALHTGNYGPGDPVYDSPAGDPGNVGYGPGRMPPGWQP